MEIPFSHVLLFFVVLVSSHYSKSNLFCSADPTDGFTEVPLTDANLELQKPYNIPLDERYSFVMGCASCGSMPTTSPMIQAVTLNHAPKFGSKLHIWQGLDYSSGVWQFEGHGFVPNGTSGATIAQIHGAAHGATTIILRIYDGDMRYYSGNLIATGLYDRWFRLNIIHDVDGGKVTVFLDGNQVFQVADKGPGDLYFKCGVYGAPTNISYYMESRWRDIKIYKK